MGAPGSALVQFYLAEAAEAEGEPSEGFTVEPTSMWSGAPARTGSLVGGTGRG